MTALRTRPKLTEAQLLPWLRTKIEQHSIPEPNSGCWLWERATNGKYGKLHVRAIGKLIFAHRASFAAYNDGRLPPVVMHKCDMPLCVNPDHLFAGTQADNIRDMHAKGRGWRTRAKQSGGGWRKAA